MEKLSESEKRLSEIKWCAQKLYELIVLEPRLDKFFKVSSEIDIWILHDAQIMGIEAKPPVIENEN